MDWVARYIGKPWEPGACGPEAFDCYGLVRAVYRDRYGIQMPALDASAVSALSCARAMRDYGDYGPWERVETAEDGGVIQMGHARRPHHVGIFVGGRILHAVMGSGVVMQSLASLRMHGWNVLATYRRRAA